MWTAMQEPNGIRRRYGADCSPSADIYYIYTDGVGNCENKKYKGYCKMVVECLTGASSLHVVEYSCRNVPHRRVSRVRMALQAPDRHCHPPGRWGHRHGTGCHGRVHRPATTAVLTCQPPLCAYGNQPAQQVAAESAGTYLEKPMERPRSLPFRRYAQPHGGGCPHGDGSAGGFHPFGRNHVVPTGRCRVVPVPSRSADGCCHPVHHAVGIVVQ